jgi:hypothetical protein
MKLKKNFFKAVSFAIFGSTIASDFDREYIKQAINKHTIKIMAIYFPQFHEVEENNKFWGQGFTEWTMLTKFKGEIKYPHPDIGYYDMLDYTTRKRQATIAKNYGISAFCYYHYWFKDKKVMYKGIEKILQDGEPNIPFIFCWANEPWTRNWDGSETEVLLPQHYGSKVDWKKHYDYLSQFFKHPNYIKEDNCPLLYIYRIGHIAEKNALPMLDYFKELARDDGFDGLKIIPILSFFECDLKSVQHVIDGLAEHQPGHNFAHAQGQFVLKQNSLELNVDAPSFYNTILNNEKIGVNYTRGIFFGFDNSSRRIHKKRLKFFNLSYDAFEKLLCGTILNIAQSPNKKNNFILINAFNEWTEQAMIEPNDVDGYSILEIIQKYFYN